MAYRSPGPRPSPRIPKHHIPDGPIQEFTTIIEKSIAEDWQKRTSALETLVSRIPSDRNNLDDYHDHWYSSAPTLRHLAIPLSELLKDARSRVVKRTCMSLNEMFSKCGSDARYLLKDLMPHICQIHACTVQVIRNYVQDMLLETLPKFPCKMTMPVWLDRLKHDKSRTVREACAMYLTVAMTLWGAADDDDFESENSGYLSREIYLQVGIMLVKTLGDPSPIARHNSKKGLEVLTSQRRDVLDELINDPRLSRDFRVIKLLKRLQAGETGVGDDASVSSRMSARSRGGVSVASAPMMRSTYNNTNRSRQAAPPPPRSRRIPTTIGVASPRSGRPHSHSHSHSHTNNNGTMGPPRRVANGISSSSHSHSSTIKTKNEPLVPTSPSTPTRAPASPSEILLSTPTQQLLGRGVGVITENKIATPMTPLDYEVERNYSNDDDEEEAQIISPNRSFDSTGTDVSVLRPIANAEELRQKAKTRTISRRSSILLQGRLLRSSSKFKVTADDTMEEGMIINHHNSSTINEVIESSITSGLTNVNDMSLDLAHLDENEISDHPGLPDHIKIAHELLEAHKLHIDQVMETLKVEMDALKDFELILLEQGPVRPTEEEIVEYFESVGLCLKQ